MCAVTLYVYNRKQQDIPPGKGSRVIENEMKTSADELAIAERKGAVKNLKRVEGALPLPQTVLAKFAAAGYTFDVRGGGCKSYVLVTGFQKYYFKIRATQYVVGGRTNDVEFHEFLK